MFIVVVLILLACVAPLSGSHANGQTATNELMQSVTFSGPSRTGMLSKRTMVELSGMAPGIKNSTLLWGVNDSGNEPHIYAFKSTGEVVCTLNVKGAKNIDWEGFATAGAGLTDGALYVGDIGDNGAKRKDITIYRVAEPVARQGSVIDVEAEVFTFTYPDKAHDAEALLVDPFSKDIFIVTKRDSVSKVYRAAAPFKNGEKRKLEFVCDLTMQLITAGDISVRGTEILLKNYVFVYHWSRGYGETVAQALARPPRFLPYMPEPQGEAICWTIRGEGYFTASETVDTAYQTEILFYRRVQDEAAAVIAKDTTRPALAVNPSRDTDGIYDVRYVLPSISNVSLSLYNEGMMRLRVIEKGAVESGAIEREIDMIDGPKGIYVVILRADGRYNAVPFVVK